MIMQEQRQLQMVVRILIKRGWTKYDADDLQKQFTNTVSYIQIVLMLFIFEKLFIFVCWKKVGNKYNLVYVGLWKKKVKKKY